MSYHGCLASLVCFLLLATVGSEAPALYQEASPAKEDDEFLSFEDKLLALTKVSENISVSLLSLKTLKCRERISVVETERKTKVSRQLEWMNEYRVSRQRDQRVNEKLIFTEVRTPAGSTGAPSGADLTKYPLLENPFTGYLLDTFSLDNRMSHDFKVVKKERIHERECTLFEFESIPQLSTRSVRLLAKPVPLRQRGRLWVEEASHLPIRLHASHLKLPKGCRQFDYQAEFSVQELSGQKVLVPTRVELRVALKATSYLVLQEYSDFLLEER